MAFKSIAKMAYKAPGATARAAIAYSIRSSGKNAGDAPRRVANLRLTSDFINRAQWVKGDRIDIQWDAETQTGRLIKNKDYGYTLFLQNGQRPGSEGGGYKLAWTYKPESGMPDTDLQVPVEIIAQEVSPSGLTLSVDFRILTNHAG